MFVLGVGIIPPGNGQRPVEDALARAILEPFRARGAFVETLIAPFAGAPGMRLFKATVEPR
jgi:hypothetical protein